MIERYVVRPRPGGGYLLTAPKLPYPLAYLDETHAGDYAHWHGSGRGGVVIYLSSKGYAFCETIERETPAQADIRFASPPGSA